MACMYTTTHKRVKEMLRFVSLDIDMQLYTCLTQFKLYFLLMWSDKLPPPPSLTSQNVLRFWSNSKL